MISALAALLLTCGSERWAVKVLSDGFVPSTAPEVSTIAELIKLPAPRWDPTLVRQDAERRTVALEASVVGYKLEADEDLHVVIADGLGRTMIVEFPSEACAPQLAAPRRAFLALVRRPPAPAFLRLARPLPVHLVGVIFFDKLHGQTGVAPNGVELHPVVSVR